MEISSQDAIALKVPDIGDFKSIELANWCVSQDSTVEEGDELCELVTDKAVFPLEAPQRGKATRFQKPQGSSVSVGETLLFLEPI